MPTSGSELSNSASEGGGGTPIALLLLHKCVGETMPRTFDWRSFGITVIGVTGNDSRWLHVKNRGKLFSLFSIARTKFTSQLPCQQSSNRLQHMDSDIHQNIIIQSQVCLSLILYSGYCPRPWAIPYACTKLQQHNTVRKINICQAKHKVNNLTQHQR